MPETVKEKIRWLLQLIEEGKKSLEGVLAENAQLREAMADTQATSNSNQQVSEVEEQFSTVSNLFVCALQLHSAWTTAEVLTIVQELLCNLVGATGFELYVYDRKREHLLSIGMQSFAGRPPPASAEARIREAIAAGETKVFPQAPWAVAPILVGTKPAAVLVVSELLAHKVAIGRTDKELLQFVGEQLGGLLLRTHRLEKAGLNSPGNEGSLAELVDP